LPGIVILRVESSLFFANADAVSQRVRAHAAQAGTRVVVLDAETAPTIDVTAVHMLAELTQSLEREGVRLLVTGEGGPSMGALDRRIPNSEQGGVRLKAR
jgi:sulfate permease, SulP family